jgi:hypothetical protein
MAESSRSEKWGSIGIGFSDHELGEKSRVSNEPRDREESNGIGFVANGRKLTELCAIVLDSAHADKAIAWGGMGDQWEAEPRKTWQEMTNDAHDKQGAAGIVSRAQQLYKSSQEEMPAKFSSNYLAGKQV